MRHDKRNKRPFEIAILIAEQHLDLILSLVDNTCVPGWIRIS